MVARTLNLSVPLSTASTPVPLAKLMAPHVHLAYQTPIELLLAINVSVMMDTMMMEVKCVINVPNHVKRAFPLEPVPLAIV